MGLSQPTETISFVLIMTSDVRIIRFCARGILHRIGHCAQSWPSCAELTKRQRNCKILPILYSSIAFISALTAATASAKHLDAKVIKQVAQLSQRDRAAGWVSFGQKWKTIYCREYRSCLQPL